MLAFQILPIRKSLSQASRRWQHKRLAMFFLLLGPIVLGLEGAVAAGATPPASFHGLGLFPAYIPGCTLPQALSGDGTTVVGYSESAAEAFRWTQSTGTISFPLLNPYGARTSMAWGVSGDGSTIVGECQIGTSTGAFIWTVAGGMHALGTSGGASASSEQVWAQQARGISGDGSTILVNGQYDPYSPWCYMLVTPTARLFTILDGTAAPVDLSDDGAVVAGTYNVIGGTHLGRWTSSTGWVDLGMPAGLTTAVARGLSPDGSTVVGYGIAPSGEWHGIYWQSEVGLVDLGPDMSKVLAASFDGSVLAGTGDGAVIWDSFHGERRIQDLLTKDFGLDLSGWQLMEATDISFDGQTITGWGFNPAGVKEGWVATLPLPEPSTLSMLGCAILWNLGRRRPRK